MKDTYLVQTLDKKPRDEFAAKIAQVFGGHGVMLSKEGWKLIQSVCSLHYMGAAEYEFDTIPKCLTALAKDSAELTTFPLIISRKFIKPNDNHERAQRIARQKELAEAKKAGKKAPKAKKAVTQRTDDPVVYVLCRKSDAKDVPGRIVSLAGDKIHLKRGCGFARALDPATDYDKESIGWLELDNGFMFFLGYEEYAGMCRIFNVEPLARPNEAQT